MMRKLRNCLLATAAVAAMVCNGSAAKAADLYSFESGLDGFFGLGAAVSADTIGATDGSTSLKYLAGGGGFVGARTETVIPAALNNPPGVKSIVFDMTIESLNPLLTFADIGITLFGHELDGGIFGIQMQFADTVSIAGLGVGQHTDLQIDLDNDLFTNQSFNDLFGDDVSDLDMVSGFQFYISKTASVPVTVYIDNVRTLVPEPASALMLGLAGCLGLIARRQR